MTYQRGKKEGINSSWNWIVCVRVCAMWEKSKSRNWLSTCYNQVEDFSKKCQTEWSKSQSESEAETAVLTQLTRCDENTWQPDMTWWCTTADFRSGLEDAHGSCTSEPDFSLDVTASYYGLSRSLLLIISLPSLVWWSGDWDGLKIPLSLSFRKASSWLWAPDLFLRTFTLETCNSRFFICFFEI